ncbi:dipeptidase PepE [Xylophilus rhododendri]|uniref:Dipeptidase PepE n=1 Tax=Xylophilus rhododendri TaxID=2697032 RepID=A0A857J4B2_9BURK|nr:dipeptidase PepE [Xylophilus rhododendri]QHI97695.1 dipeptidase PepE [Xylophilus rhododendri]
MKKLLLLSNSTGPTGYLGYALDAIAEHAKGVEEAVFVPYAGITRGWDEYEALVAGALAPIGLRVSSLHRSADPAQAVDAAQMVIVGGGNTFALTLHCRRLGLLPRIRRRVAAGMPYLGWSAGANLACPTICTTNDMPVVDPMGFDALDLIPFQINPHYTNALPEGIRGESRNQRLAEFTRANPAMPVLGLPEGNWLRVSGDAFALAGEAPSYWFSEGAEPRALVAGPLTLPA